MCYAYGMNMKSSLLLAVFLSSTALSQDKYPHFQALSQSEKLNKDYRITLVDRNSPISILAIHGGGIEPGTSELTQAIGSDYNQYLFEGIKTEGDNFDLHITSHKFDEPQGLALATRSRLCLSIHGYAKPGKKSFCLGGRNQKFALIIQSELLKLGSEFEVEFPCKAYPGMHKNNIVNLCQEAGVQVEMSQELRDQLRSDPATLKKVAEALKNAILK